MRYSARRTRSLFIRYAVSEAIAFPGIRTEWTSFPYNNKPNVDARYRDARLAYSV